MTPNLAKVPYTWTSTDDTNGYAIVHISWRSAINGDYVCTWGVNDLGPEDDISFWCGDMHNIGPNGFDAVVYVYGPNPSPSQAGTKLIVNAIAFAWNQGA